MDYREELLEKIMFGLFSKDEEMTRDMARSIIVKCIGDYEIAERCTELMVVDESNEKLIRLFLGTKKTEGGSDKTLINRQYLLKNFSEDMNKPFGKVDVFDIRLWLANKEGQAKLSTCNGYKTTLSSFFTWLKSEGFVENNPTEKLKKIKCPDAVVKSFSNVEVDSMRYACKNFRERAIIEVLVSSGIRVAELCELKWSDVDYATNELKIRKGKGNKPRTTMIDDIAKKYILAYKEKYNVSSEYMFPSSHCGVGSRTTRSVELIIHEIARKANVSDAHPHRFRHYFATTMYHRGMDVHMIQRFLGHSNINTTMIYIDNDTTSMRDAYGRCV